MSEESETSNRMTHRFSRREMFRAAVAAALSLASSKLIGAAAELPANESPDCIGPLYRGIQGLAELPYFELTGDHSLRCVVDDTAGGIDCHTHLALNCFLGPHPDLLARPGGTRYYLGMNDWISLECYMNKNQTQQVRRMMRKALADMIMPWGSRVTATHTIPNLIREMDLLGIEKAVVFPVATGMSIGDDMTERYRDAIQRSGHASRFILCASVKPTEPDAARKVRQYHAAGYRGIKLHPNFSRFYPDDPQAWPCYEAMAECGLPVLIHCGRTGQEPKAGIGAIVYSETYSDISHFEAPVAAFPDLRFVLCHAGALQNEGAIAIAKRHRNVWLDIQGQGVSAIQRMIKELGPDRLMFGSDFPFYPIAALLARLLAATEHNRTARRMILRDNARRFWGM